CKVVDDLRNFLFGQPGAGGMDLAAINILRGRERGLPDYNTIRTDFGLEAVSDFSQFSSNPLMNQALEHAYGDINLVDPWVGMLAETHMPDALFGKTAMTIVKQQFMTLRDGDRFYYENDPWLSQDEKSRIRSTRLADIIRRNTPITIIQDEIFIAQSLTGTSDGTTYSPLDFVLHPNPVEEMLFLRIPASGHQDAEIVVTDLQGRTILHREASLSDGNNTMTLTLPTHLTSG